MPSHPTRRGLLALLTLLFVFAALTQPVLARNPYAIKDGSEGDPGDGVLNPAKQSSTLVMPQYTTIGDTADGGFLWRLPVFVLPSGLSGLPSVIILPAAPWRQPLLRHQAAEPGPSGGRWHDAR